MQRRLIVLGMLVLVLAGCATSSRYINYTFQQFAPKDPLFTVNIYPAARPDMATPYYVIGKVAVEGFASSGVTPETLAAQAKDIARRKGADAIINAKTEIFRYYGGDALLRFKGEFIVYSPKIS